eukprot:CAMPEP_0170217430 /NCGR_PEP_ID=MMETSP0116_2-20130129/8380_1 /TAXON_ID=400756 /ORGANISM="Durinskia baltica, Strain CSIRO CS-38" /LENGTH=112 /DNA_ID=CAMNT_0010468063 /DNA_START=150 /DNA_END=485 /DNA_ORIENTATION=-
MTFTSSVVASSSSNSSVVGSVVGSDSFADAHNSLRRKRLRTFLACAQYAASVSTTAFITALGVCRSLHCMRLDSTLAPVFFCIVEANWHGTLRRHRAELVIRDIAINIGARK